MTQAHGQPASQAGTRSSTDVSALLIELGRAVRACRFYEPGHPVLRDILERAYQAWRADLERHGPLDVEVRGGSFRLAGGGAVAGGPLGELARAFEACAMERLHFDAELEGQAFRALTEAMAHAEPAEHGAPGGARGPRAADAGAGEGSTPARPPGSEAGAAATAVEDGPPSPEADIAALVQQVISPDSSLSDAAARTVLERGAPAVGELVAAIASDCGARERELVSALVIAIGTEATPELARTIEAGPPQQARAAARLAGEIRDPRAIPALRGLLAARDGALHREATTALARIGGEAVVDALAEALSSRVDGVPETAALALGVGGSPRALRLLLSFLRRSLRDGSTARACEAIRALGQLGVAEAAPDLAELLLRRNPMRRRKLRELQLAAAAALGRLPGSEARAALVQAERRGDSRLRAAVRDALRGATAVPQTPRAAPRPFAGAKGLG